MMDLKKRKAELEKELSEIRKELDKDRVEELKQYVGKYYKRFGKYMRIEAVNNGDTLRGDEVNCTGGFCYFMTDHPISRSEFEERTYDESELAQEVTEEEYYAELEKLITKAKEMRKK